MSDGIMIMYDVANKLSFEKVQEWVQSVYDTVGNTIKMILIGNKIDLDRQVTTEEGRKLAEYYKIPFFETSAKEGVKLHESIIRLVTDVLENKENSEKLNLKNFDENKNHNQTSCIC